MESLLEGDFFEECVLDLIRWEGQQRTHLSTYARVVDLKVMMGCSLFSMFVFQT